MENQGKQELSPELQEAVMGVVEKLLAETATMSSAPTKDDGDSKRGKISIMVLVAGAILTAASLTAVPQLSPLAFGLTFLGIVLIMVWLVDKYFFPEEDTFKKVGENAIAVAVVFFAIVLTCIEGIKMGAVLFAIPNVDSTEQSATAKSIETTIQHYSPPPAPDTATGGQGGEPTGK